MPIQKQIKLSSNVSFDETPPPVEKRHLHKNNKLLSEEEIINARDLFNLPENKDKQRLKFESSTKMKYTILKMGDPQHPRYFVVYLGKKRGKHLGEGGFGKVKLMQEITDGKEATWYALKVQNIGLTTNSNNVNLKTDYFKKSLADEEVATLEETDRGVGSYIRTELNKANEARVQYFIGMKYAPGDEMFDVIYNKNTKLPPQDWMSIATNTLIATAELHEKNFLHRDIKPENYRVDLRTGEVSLIDLGFAKKTKDDGQGNKVVEERAYRGTPGYIAPEISSSNFNNVYSEKSDVYSLGITLAQLLSLGDLTQTFNQITNKWVDGPFQLNSPDTENVKIPDKMMRAEMIDYLKKMTDPDPKNRPTIEDATQYFLSKHAMLQKKHDQSQVMPNPSIEPRIKPPYMRAQTIAVKRGQPKKMVPLNTIEPKIINEAPTPKLSSISLNENNIIFKKGKQHDKLNAIMSYILYHEDSPSKKGNKFIHLNESDRKNFLKEITKTKKFLHLFAENIDPVTLSTLIKNKELTLKNTMFLFKGLHSDTQVSILLNIKDDLLENKLFKLADTSSKRNILLNPNWLPDHEDKRNELFKSLSLSEKKTLFRTATMINPDVSNELFKKMDPLEQGAILRDLWSIKYSPKPNTLPHIALFESLKGDKQADLLHSMVSTWSFRNGSKVAKSIITSVHVSIQADIFKELYNMDWHHNKDTKKNFESIV